MKLLLRQIGFYITISSASFDWFLFKHLNIYVVDLAQIVDQVELNLQNTILQLATCKSIERKMKTLDLGLVKVKLDKMLQKIEISFAFYHCVFLLIVNLKIAAIKLIQNSMIQYNSYS